MATHMRLPFQQQHLHQPEPEQLMRRAVSWEASAMAVDHHETWPATCRESTQAAGTHNIGAGGNTWSKRIASAAASNLDSDSWEVRAFAEDASSSGQWPPRSYSCSFCQREFRTAQALGGHMNVHRRERAHANQMAQLRNAATTTTTKTSTSSDQIITTAHQVGNAAADYHWRPSARTSSSSDLTLLQSSDLSLLKNTDLSLLKASDPVSPVKSLPFSPQLSLSRGSMSGGLSSSCVLSTSPPSQESISSTNSGTTITTAIMQQEHGGGNLRLMETTTTPTAQLNFENLSAAAPNYSGSWSAGAFHPYEKSLEQSTAAINLRRFSLCFSQSMQRDQYHQDDTLDLELRLGQGPCTV